MGTVKYTGPVASFHCPTSADIRSLKVHFSPKQEGTGNPSPENVRPIVGWDGVEVFQKGKNLFDYTNTIIIDKKNRNSDGVQVPDGTGSYNQTPIDVQPLTQYTMNGFGTKSSKAVYYLKKDGSWISKEQFFMKTGPWIFTTPQDCYQLQVQSAEVANALWETLVIEVGSGSGLRTPYYGSTTNYTFGVLGKNKFNWDVPVSESSPVSSDAATARQFTLDTYVIGMSVNNYYRQNYANWVLNPSVENGVISFSSNAASGYGIAFPLKLAAGQTYFLSGTGDGAVGATYYDENGELISYQNGRLNKTITVPENAVTTLIGFYASTSNTDFTFSNIQLELGSTATAYEPYNPNHTVYGGWVDLINGEVCEEWAKVTMEQYTKAAEMHQSPGENIYSADFGLPYIYGCFMSDVRLSKCNCLEYNSANEANTFKLRYFVVGRDGFDAARKFDVNIYSETPLDETGIRDYLANINFELYYKTTAPMNTYNLAPIELQTFLGHNNVWSNADYVEVEYDLHETQDILARKNFIIANQPHVEEASGAIATFNTDMAAKLKECKVYFKPVQEGEGDPSPENVRTISGWTGINVIRCGKNLYSGNYGEPANLSIPFEINSTISIETTSTKTKYIYIYDTYGNQISAIAFKDSHVGLLWGRSRSFEAIPKWESNSNAMAQIQVANYTNNDTSKVQVELGLQQTAYAPYSGTTISINWSDSAGTIYGGYVDLVTGEVWKTYHEINITELGTYRTLSINKNNNTQISWFLSNHLNAPEATGYVAYSRDGYCSCAPFYVNNYYWDSKCQVNNSTADLVIEGELTAEEVDNWIKAHAPIQIVYPLKTSELITTLTPTQLKSLRGTNNIWSNANGNIELSYWKH